VAPESHFEALSLLFVPAEGPSLGNV